MSTPWEGVGECKIQNYSDVCTIYYSLPLDLVLGVVSLFVNIVQLGINCVPEIITGVFVDDEALRKRVDEKTASKFK